MTDGKHGGETPEGTIDRRPGWSVPLWLVVVGILLTIIAINVWPLLLFSLGVSPAVIVELVFLGLFVWWTSGDGPPRSTGTVRARAFRRGRLSPGQWFWGCVAALVFAATIHAAIVVLFRLVPFPTAVFRQGYSLSFIPSLPLRWLAVLFSAISAGVCEEAGFRGYVQLPLEPRFGAPVAILIS